MEKILDLNLDVIARTYHEEEMRRVFLSYRLDNALIRFAHRFTFGLNMLLLLGLIGLSRGSGGGPGPRHQPDFYGQSGKRPGVGPGFFADPLADDRTVGRGDRPAPGGEPSSPLFVGVALVAFIRKVLVASLARMTCGPKSFTWPAS